MIRSIFKGQFATWRQGFYLACALYGISWLLGIIITIKFAPQQTLQHLLITPGQTHDAWYYISHNIGVEAVLLLGACTLGIGTGIVLCLNGLFDGILSTAIALHYGPGVLLVGLLPHGIFEAGAWIIISTCSFLLSSRLKRLLSSIWSRNNTNPSENKVLKTHSSIQIQHLKNICFTLIITSTFLLMLAGMIEAYISPLLVLMVH